jgi:hypothetical protein
LTLIGLLHPDDEVRDLTVDLNAIGLGIAWNMVGTYISQNYSPVLSGLDALRDEPATVYAGSIVDQDSRTGVIALEQFFGAWSRPAIGASNDSATDGPRIPYPTYLGYWPNSISGWKSVVPGRNKGTSTQVFDWEMGAPILLKAIDARFLIMNKIDPNFTTDHMFDSEISMQYSALASYYNTMTAGVQCASQDFTYFQSNNYVTIGGVPTYNGPINTTIYGCNIVCADVYTGISALSSLIPPQPAPAQYGAPWPNATYTWTNSSYWVAKDTSAQCSNVSATAAYSNAQHAAFNFVNSKLPLFAMRSELDVLYRILHPGPDLTQDRGEFEAQVGATTASSRLCADFQGGVMSQGAQLQLRPCAYTNSQWWAYNRQTGQIENPPTGFCVDVEFANALPGTPIWAWPCSQPQGNPPQISNLAQEWTYDPQAMRLQNALGTVLNATGIIRPSSGAFLNTAYSYPSGGLFASLYYPMQEWHADLYTDPFP